MQITRIAILVLLAASLCLASTSKLSPELIGLPPFTKVDVIIRVNTDLLGNWPNLNFGTGKLKRRLIQVRQIRAELHTSQHRPREPFLLLAPALWLVHKRYSYLVSEVSALPSVSR